MVRSQLDDAYFLRPQPAPPRQPNASVPASPYRPSHTATSVSMNASMSSPPGSGSRGTVAPAATGTSRHASSLPLTPLRGSNPMGGRPAPAIPQTPMSSQLDAVGWLTRAAPATVDTGASSSPLAKFFQGATGLSNVRATVQERLARLLRPARIMLLDNEQGPSKEAVEAVEEQLELSERLYFKMLLSFLMAEEKRLGKSDFSELLANEAFHTSLLACCLESVFASYSTQGMGFPEVLRVLSLKAFDFAKVIESFIRHEPHLPAHLKLHFEKVESKIIESLAWCDDSPLHSLMAEYDASRSAGAAGASSAGPSRARAALEQFVRKYLFHAAKRIQELCLRLLLDAALTQQVWDVSKLVIDSARDLLVGRHLDQILMCAVYGVCKVNQRQVTFRQIIEQYKRQPGASPRTFREVRLEKL